MAKNETLALVAAPLVVRYRFTYLGGGSVEKVRCMRTGQGWAFYVHILDRLA